MLAVGVVYEVDQRRRAGGGLAIGGRLRVEHAERVLLEAPLRVLAELVAERGEVGEQRVAVALARAARAQRVDVDLEAGDADRREEACDQIDHLGVAERAGIAVKLAPGLIELPVAALRGALAAEHRPEVVPARDRLQGVHLVLDVGARGARRALGAHRERVAVALERVHLLLHHVRRLADGSREERGVLEQRRPHLGVAVELGVTTEDRLEPVPAHHLVRKDVVHPSNRAEFHVAAALWSDAAVGSSVPQRFVRSVVTGAGPLG